MTRLSLISALGLLAFVATAACAEEFVTPDFTISLPDGWKGPSVQKAGSSAGYMFALTRDGSLVPALLYIQVTDISGVMEGEKESEAAEHHHAQYAAETCVKKISGSFSEFQSNPPKSCPVGGRSGICARWKGASSEHVSMSGMCVGWAVPSQRILMATASDSTTHEPETIPIVTKALEGLRQASEPN